MELCTKETLPVHQLWLFHLRRIKIGAHLICRWLSISKGFMDCELNEAQMDYMCGWGQTLSMLAIDIHRSFFSCYYSLQYSHLYSMYIQLHIIHKLKMIYNA